MNAEPLVVRQGWSFKCVQFNYIFLEHDEAAEKSHLIAWGCSDYPGALDEFRV